MRGQYEAKSPNVRYVENDVVAYPSQSATRPKKLRFSDEESDRQRVKSPTRGTLIEIDRNRASPIRSRTNTIQEGQNLKYQLRQTTAQKDVQLSNRSYKQQELDIHRRLRKSPKRIAHPRAQGGLSDDTSQNDDKQFQNLKG